MMEYDFDLDVWFELAKTDLDQFEVRRRELIEQIIPLGTDIRRLKGLQFQIEMQRQKSKNPMDACIRLTQMMNEHIVTEFVPTCAQIEGDNSIAIKKSQRGSADIIPLKD